METTVSNELKRLIINNFQDFSKYTENDNVWDEMNFEQTAINSVDFVKLLVSIEKNYNILIEEEYLYNGRIKCFNDLVSHIEEKLNA